jgi:hypothetical protein
MIYTLKFFDSACVDLDANRQPHPSPPLISLNKSLRASLARSVLFR